MQGAASGAVAQLALPTVHYLQGQKFESRHKLKSIVKVKSDLGLSRWAETL